MVSPTAFLIFGLLLAWIVITGRAEAVWYALATGKAVQGAAGAAGG